MNLSHTTFFWLLFVFAFSAPVLAQQKTDKYENGVELKKGIMFSTFSLAASNRLGENDQQLLGYYVDQKRKRFELNLDPGYMIKKNLGIGLGLSYGHSKENNIQQATDGTLTVNNIAESHYTFRPFVKGFIPLGKTNKFYIIIPAEVQIGHGSTIRESTTNSILTRTYTSSTNYGLAMRPGILAFLVKNFGFEVNVGALGLSSSVDKTTKTDQPDGKVVKNDFNLKINLLDLSLGFSVYF